MRKDIADRWVEALRSGKYQQTTSELKSTTTGAMCCLGVLCTILDVPEEEGRFGNDVDYSAGVLPEYVKIEVGMKTVNGELPRNISIKGETMDRHCLSSANDDGCTFEQIADIIEKHYASI